MSKRNLDRLFSLYIRLRDYYHRGKCITCGRAIHYTSCDAGHFIPRRYMSLRYHPLNCFAQCRTCNQFQDGRRRKYKANLEKLLGANRVASLIECKNVLFKPDKYWMKRYAYILRNRIETLKRLIQKMEFEI